MILYAAIFAFGCFALAILMNLWKVLFADAIADRILALDTMFINAIALMVLYGIALGTGIYFEAAMIVAMLGFVSTVAYARFILRGNIIE
ncbi:K+/H+ antiporter subunit F [Parasedimentitalea maritima]|uniref:K+/H+ antiporter subunit F n=2 Tax=Parasedimentitalea TaxID=2738399 RepID=A0A6L6WI22_9RHOB|nr:MULTISPECIES: K+/H+ antiporter subunit F [Zongyanglinia]MVO17476.1 K+/H+ antiporter subunit F [Zongyanglinia huanghaiensis]TLP60360.1 K+/H+ antiporter subunit F [Zongyanglinia marina]